MGLLAGGALLALLARRRRLRGGSLLLAVAIGALPSAPAPAITSIKQVGPKYLPNLLPGNGAFGSSVARLPDIDVLARLTRAIFKFVFDQASVGVVKDGYFRRSMANGCRKHLATVADPELRRKLTPDYALCITTILD